MTKYSKQPTKLSTKKSPKLTISKLRKRGISISFAPKVGIFPETKDEVNIHYQGGNIIDYPQGRVEYLIYFIC